MKQKAYRIKRWWERHSSGEQRRRKGVVVEFPTDMTSEGLSILMETAEGRSAFAVYCLLAEFAGTLPAAINGEDAQGNDTGPAQRALAGVLIDDRGPFDCNRLARKLPASAKVIGIALKRLMADDVAWVDQVDPAEILRSDSGDFSGHTPDDVPDNSRADSVSRVRVPAHAHASAGAPAQAGQAGLANTAAPLTPQDDDPAVALARRFGLAGEKVGAVAGLPTAEVLAHWLDVKGKSEFRSPPAVMLTRIQRNDKPTPLTTARVAAACKDGDVLAINGTWVNGGKVGWNSLGVTLNGQTLVSAADLREAVYQ